MSHEHHTNLESLLPHESHTWRWIDRNNAASSHPTDFAILSVPSTMGLEESRRMLSSPLLDHYVRDVHMDRRFIGKLNWIPTLDKEREGEEGKEDVPHATDGMTLEALRALREAVITVGGSDLTGSFFPSTDTQPTGEEGDSDGSGGGDEDLGISVQKRSGRITTRFSFESDQELKDSPSRREEEEQQTHLSDSSSSGRHLSSSSGRHLGPNQDHPRPNPHPYHRRLKGVRLPLTTAMGADRIWSKGFTGEGVKVGAFDTGISSNHPHIRNIKERTNWTHQSSLDDGLGHGSFVAGIIGSQDKECLGLAPDVELYTFKVFTDDQVSFTSWFLDAFNYAMIVGVNVINLSIGGPDYLDHPFVDKVLEVTSSGILLVSAIGNDGPLWGTLNNPADEPSVIGVGGMTFEGHIAGFSSRGMTTHGLPLGSGQVKPDLVAHGDQVMGSRMGSGCKTLSGTSVASPVVAGAIALLASTIPKDIRWSLLNPGTMKQILVEGAVKIQGGAGIYEQGSGKIDLSRSHDLITARIKEVREGKGKGKGLKASVIPQEIDLSSAACPYAWPYCRQPLYHDAMPLIFNATVINGMGVTGSLVGPPVFKPLDEGGKHLHLSFEWSEELWPWSGYLALFIRVLPSGSRFAGVASGEVTFTVTSPPLPSSSPLQGQGKDKGKGVWLESEVKVQVRVSIVPTPERKKRVLWDNFHSIRYPPGYVPRDNLDIKYDVLDWHGDKLATNFHQTFNQLREAGYSIEELNSPLTCFDARSFGTLLIVDPEEEFYPEEVAKLEDDVRVHGLSVVVFGEWYNLEAMRQARFFDDNTRSWWTPITGGSNVPALNDLLKPFGIALGDAILSGGLKLAGLGLKLSSAADVAKMPSGSYLHRTANIQSSVNYGYELGGSKATDAPGFGVLGVAGPLSPSSALGYVSVFGDSSCLDSSHQSHNCVDLLRLVLDETMGGGAGEGRILSKASRIEQDFERKGFMGGPVRRPGFDMTPFSIVLSHPIQCYSNSPCEVQPKLKPFPRHGSSLNSNLGALESLTGFPSSSCVGWVRSNASHTSPFSSSSPTATATTKATTIKVPVDLSSTTSDPSPSPSPSSASTDSEAEASEGAASLIPSSQLSGSTQPENNNLLEGFLHGLAIITTWVPSSMASIGARNLLVLSVAILALGLVILGVMMRARQKAGASHSLISSAAPGSLDNQRLQAMTRAMSGSHGGIGMFGRARRGDSSVSDV